MQEIISFLMQHWVLAGALVIVLFMLFYEERRSAAFGSGWAITPQAAVGRINKDKAVVVDLRSEEQFKKGHIVSAMNASYTALEEELKKLQRYQDKSMIVICPLNKSAIFVLRKLRKMGFKKAEIVSGGMAAWEKEGLPIVKN